MRALLALVLLAATAVLAGCGGGGGGDGKAAKAEPQTPEAAVTAAARTWGLTKDPAVGCGTLATARLVREYYLSRERCEQGAAANNDVRTQAAVSDVRVNGDGATARLRNRFDDLRPVEGTVELVREAGDWKVDVVRADYQQSLVIALVTGAQRGLLTDQYARQCFSGAVRKLDATETRRLLRTIDEDPQGKGVKRIVRLLRPCPTVVNSYVVRTVVAKLQDVSPSPVFRRCLSKRLAVFTQLKALRLAEAALTGDPTGRFQGFLDSLGISCLGAVESAGR